MHKGKFTNRKLAKRAGHAQRQTRLALETGRGGKQAPSPKKERAIMIFRASEIKEAGNIEGNHEGS